MSAGLVSGALLVGSTAAGAAPVQVSISPWTALSALGTQASATSLCGSSTAAAAAGAAATQARPGCVLPVVDPAPVPVAEVAPLPPLPVEGGGIGISPLILGLGALALAGLIYLIVSDDPQPGASPD